MWEEMIFLHPQACFVKFQTLPAKWKSHLKPPPFFDPTELSLDDQDSRDTCDTLSHRLLAADGELRREYEILVTQHENSETERRREVQVLR